MRNFTCQGDNREVHRDCRAAFSRESEGRPTCDASPRMAAFRLTEPIPTGIANGT
jgi:hypothetical protein